MDRLYLVLPQNRISFGYSEPVDESQFLRDIPEELLKVDGRIIRRSRTGLSRPDRWESRISSVRVLEPQYHPGNAVVHPVWGEGMVLNSRIQDDEEIVDVFFADIGLKRLAASLAKLELK
jgi:DNA helicase-2/ATP-dependent DNA helicase PcrA